jgi:molecular chaperone GrpE
MVNNNDNEQTTEDIELTNDSTDTTDMDDSELVDDEASVADKLKSLRTKLAAKDEENRTLREDIQRTKADFLNARKRQDEERSRERERFAEAHIEELIPLYDSFAMAMQNTEAWEAIDKNWRVGVEGIFAQLQGIFASYGVTAVRPLGETFDPMKHDALKNEPVTDEAQHDTIIKVVQVGFTRTTSTGTTTLRPARVIVGIFTK